MRSSSRIAVLLLICGIFIAALWAFLPLLDVAVLALSLAVVVMPLRRRLVAFLSDGSAALLITCGVVAAVSAVIAFAVRTVLANGAIIQGAAGALSAPLPGVPDSAGDFAAALAEGLVAEAGETILGIPLIAFKMLLFFLVLWIVVAGGDRIWEACLTSLPPETRTAVLRLSKRVVDTLYAIYVVHLSTSLVTFLLALPFFYLLGYGNAVFYAFVAAVFQLFPLVGDSVLFLILAAVSWAAGDIRGLLLIVFVGYPVVSAFPDLYYRPLMMGNRAAIHPALMWIGFFGGAAVLGTVGIVVGPVIVALIVGCYPLLLGVLDRAGDGGA